MLTVNAGTDAAVFLKQIAALVDREPVLTNVVARNAARAADDPQTFEDPYWVWMDDPDGRPVGAAIHTPPRPPHLAAKDPAAGVALADHLAESGRPVCGIGGMRPVAEAFADRWVQRRPCEVRTTMDQGVYEATAVTAPAAVPGCWRTSTASDVRLLNEWARGFLAHTPDPAPAGEDLITDKVVDGAMWLWEHGGEPVSMAYASPPAGGVSGVSWVYTPPEHRRHGYASAVVAAVTRAQLDAGSRCMLYTDLANPTSNAIYQAIGYRRIGDAVVLAFDGPRS
jgi:predicted GNAT family acetyltransferase